MKKEDFAERILSIGQLEDASEIREQLAQLNDDMTEDFDRLTELETVNQTLTAQNENLQAVNMRLFLRVGEQKTSEPTQTLPGEEPVKKNFEDLFNEKGGLK